jgi:hypothetical protein
MQKIERGFDSERKYRLYGAENQNTNVTNFTNLTNIP